jgi:putative ABC transport system permease protein
VDTTDPGLVGLAASGVLVAVAVGWSWWHGLGVERSILWASTRALVQLALVGVALGLVLEPGRPVALSWAWVAVMVLFAGWTSRRRAPEVPGLFVLSAVSYAAALAVSLGVLFGFGVFPVEARTIVPLAGLVVGNSLAATVLVGRRVLDELAEHRDEVEARLALGMTSTRAAQPFLRRAARTALIPQIETTKAVGIVFLPGAMVGLILAGASPAGAARVQLAVMYLILGSVATTVTIVSLGVRRRAFTPDHRLADAVRRDRDPNA